MTVNVLQYASAVLFICSPIHAISLTETQLALIKLSVSTTMLAMNYLMKYPDEMDISSLTDRVL